MTRRKKTWLISLTAFCGLGFVALLIAGYVLSQRLDPYIRQQAILYLQQRFDGEVELSSLTVRLPHLSPLKLLFNGGRGTLARIEGEGLRVRLKGRRDVPALFSLERFSSEIDLGTLFDVSKRVQSVLIDGMNINVPPKEDKADRAVGGVAENSNSHDSQTSVIIDQVVITNSILTILPKDPRKTPLRFDIHRAELKAVGPNSGMKYDAALLNAKPPGEILTRGTFGPWVADAPGTTPIQGEYEFQNADLSVFKGIAGVLSSTGKFEGNLSSLSVTGQANVPDFRLTVSGNRVPLKTQFAVLVDGTNGNTILQPVTGTIGSTLFKTSGGVIKHESDPKRTIDLDVSIPKGNIKDLLTLGMKGSPFMSGDIAIQTKIKIPPLTTKVIEKLRLDGQFDLSKGIFLQSRIQDRIDGLSKRGQGQPRSEEIDQVISGMAGAFKLENQVMAFSALSFAVPGAGVDLVGSYDLDSNALAFYGALKLQATISQTMSGWKHWALKPVDPFFAKGGVGTLLHIKIEGTDKAPKFGLDLGKHQSR